MGLDANKRNSNFELLRIFLMVMIIAHHYVIHGIMSLEGKVNYSVWHMGTVLNKIVSIIFLPWGGYRNKLIFYDYRLFFDG